MTKTKSKAFRNEVLPGPPAHRSSILEDSPFVDGQLRFDTFLDISEEYKHEYGYSLVYCDNQGGLLYGVPYCSECSCQSSCAEYRRTVLEESLSSGAIVSYVCDENVQMWGIPVMLNNTFCGGLVVIGDSYKPVWRNSPNSINEVEIAGQGLLALAAKYNVVNLAFLENQRANLLRIDRFARPSNLRPNSDTSKLKKFLADLEPKLLEQVRNRDIGAARSKMDEVALLILSLPKDHLCIAKGFVLDLLISINHASMEAGSDFTTLMRYNCSVSFEVCQIEDARSLSELLRKALDQALKVMSPYHKKQNDVTLKNIVSYLEKNFHKNLSRKLIAARFGMSISHLSHLLSKKIGRTFVEILNQYRSDRAAQLLVTTDRSLVEISGDCGFHDQSYFGKVFRSRYGMSPGKYRKVKLSSQSDE